MLCIEDTIAAIASPAGGAARGIIRLSGPDSRAVLQTIWQATADFAAVWSRKVPTWQTGRIACAGSPRGVPCELAIWPTSRSYTGQPAAECHLPGSPPLLEGVLTELCRHGARLAGPGEFTLRAFLAGKLDLLQAEAVLGVIQASDLPVLRNALEQLAGGLSSEISRLRSELLDLLADLEAGLDFADEHLEFVTHAALLSRLGAAREQLQRLVHAARGRQHSGTRPQIVLAGPPNAGKSTLFNRLLGRDRALVSEIRGTTRDYLVANFDSAEGAWELVDTAGYETAEDGISRQAQQLRAQQWRQASVLLWCTASDEPFLPLPDFGDEPPGLCLLVRTKADLGDSSTELPTGCCSVSARTGAGMDELCQRIASHLELARRHSAEWTGSASARSQDALQGANAALQRAENVARAESDQVLLAAEIRHALDELGQITGAIYTDDILDRVFSRFCIGK